MPMQMGFRWYGQGNDSIKLSDIKQIPGVTSIVWALHHKMPGEIWEEAEIAEVMDQLHDTKNTEAGWLDRIALRSAYGKLGQREKQILSLRFVGGKTQMEVASMVGISQAQVSRLEKNALSSMRKNMTS